jgi:branched-chain amino acid transport system substrate-binding protein
MRLKKSLLLWIAICAMAPGLPARAQTAEPLLIGVPMPLTGVLAQAGQLILAGIRYGTDEANKNGGILGRQIKLIVEDTKGEPNTAAAVATKMASDDKVFAFVGGFGSTADFAMLQSIKRYQPIFIHPASSAVRLEQGFGKEPWYFHNYVWDYHRQKAVTRFLSDVAPKPKTIAIAFEDGLYGSDAAKYSEKYLTEAGFQMVMKEPYKAGSPDFAPILSRVKSLDPDVFYFVGYSGDNIQIARQGASLGIKPKMLLILAAGEKRPDFGDIGTGIAVLSDWSPEQKTPGNAEFAKKMAADLNMPVITPTPIQGYVGINVLLGAIRAAKSFDREAVLTALRTTTFSTPYGEIKYRESEGGGLQQLLTDENLIVMQYRDQGQDVVWPAAKATGKVVYPTR